MKGSFKGLWRRTIALCLTLVMVLGCDGFSSKIFAATSETNYDFTVEYKDGVLTVSGNNCVVDTDSLVKSDEFQAHWNDIQSLVFEEGIVKIYSLDNRSFLADSNGKSISVDIQKLVIPKTVTSIGRCSFYGLEFKTVEYNAQNASSYEPITGNFPPFYGHNMTLILGDSVESIGDYMFYGAAIDEVEWSKSLKSIGEYAFYGNKLIDLDLSDTSVREIDTRAFDSSKSLQTVELPKTLGTGIFRDYDFGFSNCPKLKSIDVDPECKDYYSKNGVLFRSGDNYLMAFPAAKTGVYQVPSEVEGIWKGAFSATNLTVLKMNNQITSVPADMCENSTTLRKVDLKNVTSIGGEAFQNCTHLSEIKMDKVTSLGKFAFDGMHFLFFDPTKIEKYSEGAMYNIDNIYLSAGGEAEIEDIMNASWYYYIGEGVDIYSSEPNIYYLVDDEKDSYLKTKYVYKESLSKEISAIIYPVTSFEELAQKTIDEISTSTPEIDLVCGEGYAFPVFWDNSIYGGAEEIWYTLNDSDTHYEISNYDYDEDFNENTDNGYFQLLNLPKLSESQTLKITLYVKKLNKTVSKEFEIRVNDYDNYTLTYGTSSEMYAGDTIDLDFASLTCMDLADIISQIEDKSYNGNKDISITIKAGSGADCQIGISFLPVGEESPFSINFLNWLGENKFVTYSGATYSLSNYDKLNDSDQVKSLLLGLMAESSGSDTWTWEQYEKSIEDLEAANKVSLTPSYINGLDYKSGETWSLLNIGTKNSNAAFKFFAYQDVKEIITEYSDDANYIYRSAEADFEHSFDLMLFCPNDYESYGSDDNKHSYTGKVSVTQAKDGSESTLNVDAGDRTYHTTGEYALKENADLQKLLAGDDFAVDEIAFKDMISTITNETRDQITWTDSANTVEEIDDDLWRPGMDIGTSSTAFVYTTDEQVTGYITEDGSDFYLSAPWRLDEKNNFVKEDTSVTASQAGSENGDEALDTLLKDLGIESFDSLTSQYITSSEATTLSENTDGVTVDRITIKPTENTQSTTKAQVSYIEDSGEVADSAKITVSAFKSKEAATQANQNQATVTAVGKTYQIKLTDGDGQEVTDPVEVSLAYDLDWIKALSNYEEGDENSLVLLKYDEETSSYIEVAPLTSDGEGTNSGSAEISESGQYILGIDQVAPSVVNINASKAGVSSQVADYNGIKSISLEIKNSADESILAQTYDTTEALASVYDADTNLFSYSISDENALADGTYTVSITATDKTDRGTTTTTEFTIATSEDTTAPTIGKITGPTTCEQGSLIKVSARISDDDVENCLMYYSATLEDGETVTGQVSGEKISSGYRAILPDKISENATSISVTVLAMDSSGNIAVSDTYVITLTQPIHKVEFYSVDSDGNQTLIDKENLEEGIIAKPEAVENYYRFGSVTYYKDEDLTTLWDFDKDEVKEDCSIYVVIAPGQTVDISGCTGEFASDEDAKKLTPTITYEGMKLTLGNDYTISECYVTPAYVKLTINGMHSFIGSEELIISYDFSDVIYATCGTTWGEMTMPDGWKLANEGFKDEKMEDCYSYDEWNKAAKCYDYYVCVTCDLNANNSQTHIYVNPYIYHKYEEIEKEPTCRETGYKASRCTECGNYEYFTTIAKKTHKWSYPKIYWAIYPYRNHYSSWLSCPCKYCGYDSAEEVNFPTSDSVKILKYATSQESGKAICTATYINPRTKKKEAVAKSVIVAKIQSVSLKSDSLPYTGEAITNNVLIKDSAGNTITGNCYTVTYKNNTKIGTATATITMTGAYSGTFTRTFKIVKADNPMTVSAGKTYSKSTLAKKAQAFTITVKDAKGTVSYTSSSKYVTVTSKGKVTVKKGTPKGTYTVTVKAKGDSNYKAGSKTVKIVVN